MEVRDRYNPSDESEPLRRFLAGEPDDLAWFRNWLSRIRATTIEGRRFSRVRVVSRPFTDYSRFALFCSQHANAAGEDIRYLTREQAEGLPDHDYWLFDSRTLVLMHFDDEDYFLGGEVIQDSAEIVQHNYWRDMARHRSVRREEFASE